MSVDRTIAIDRIALTLDGVDADDARLLAGGLGAAIEARLAGDAGGSDDGSRDSDAPSDAPLVTALRGQALVVAVASRLVAAMAIGGQRPAPSEESRPWR